MKTFKKIILGTALAATSLTVAAPASARDYYRGHRGGDEATSAIVGGVIGLALGAAIASSSHRGYDDYSYQNGGWYEGYQYNNGGFYDRQGQRRYDRHSWQHRQHDGDRGNYQRGYNQYGGGQYGNGYNGGGYNGYSRGY